MSSSGWKRVNVKVHFATLIEVLMTAIEFGMDSAPEICVERVRSLRRELKLVVERLNTYLQLHYMLLTPFVKSAQSPCGSH